MTVPEFQGIQSFGFSVSASASTNGVTTDETSSTSPGSAQLTVTIVTTAGPFAEPPSRPTRTGQKRAEHSAGVAADRDPTGLCARDLWGPACRGQAKSAPLRPFGKREHQKGRSGPTKLPCCGVELRPGRGPTSWTSVCGMDMSDSSKTILRVSFTTTNFDKFVTKKRNCRVWKDAQMLFGYHPHFFQFFRIYHPLRLFLLFICSFFARCVGRWI